MHQPDKLLWAFSIVLVRIHDRRSEPPISQESSTIAILVSRLNHESLISGQDFFEFDHLSADMIDRLARLANLPLC